MVFNQNINISTEKRFRMLYILLRLVGIPLCMKKIPKLYYLYSATVIISMYVFYVGACLDTFAHEGNQKETISSFRVWSAASVITYLHVIMSIRRRKIEELIFFTESFIWEDLPTRDSKTGYLTQAGFLTRIEKIMKLGVIMLPTYHAIQSTFRVITSDELIYSVWYPFDFRNSPTYEVIFISQIFASIICTTQAFGFMLLYSSLVVIACSQLEKLRGKLSAIKWTNTMLQKAEAENEQSDYYGLSDPHQIMLNQLKDCVKFHQLILEYMKMLEDNLHLTLGGTLLINLFALLLSSFSVVTNWGDFTDISQGVAGYILFSLNAYIICATGNGLSKEAEKVRDVAWDCDWIGAPIPFQRNIKFIIARTNKDFTLTAAKFVPVSMVTFMKMMQQTMSYFMFLLEMKKQ